LDGWTDGLKMERNSQVTGLHVFHLRLYNNPKLLIDSRTIHTQHRVAVKYWLQMWNCGAVKYSLRLRPSVTEGSYNSPNTDNEWSDDTQKETYHTSRKKKLRHFKL